MPSYLHQNSGPKMKSILTLAKTKFVWDFLKTDHTEKMKFVYYDSLINIYSRQKIKFTESVSKLFPNNEISYLLWQCYVWMNVLSCPMFYCLQHWPCILNLVSYSVWSRTKDSYRNFLKWNKISMSLATGLLQPQFLGQC